MVLVSLSDSLNLCNKKAFTINCFYLAFQFTRNYTKLTVLSFLHCFVVKGNLISAK